MNVTSPSYRVPSSAAATQGSMTSSTSSANTFFIVLSSLLSPMAPRRAAHQGSFVFVPMLPAAAGAGLPGRSPESACFFQGRRVSVQWIAPLSSTSSRTSAARSSRRLRISAVRTDHRHAVQGRNSPGIPADGTQQPAAMPSDALSMSCQPSLSFPPSCPP